MFSQRINIVRIFIYVSFILIVSGLFYFQVIEYRYYHALSLKNAIKLIPIEGSRGRISDRNNQPLATNDISLDLAIIPKKVEDIKATLAELSRLSGISAEELLRNYKRNYYLPFAPVRIAANLDREKAFYIEENLYSIPGALIWSTPRRYYPNRETASHILGYIGRIEEDELYRLKDYGYQPQDLVGKSGIEKYYDAYLKGEDGGIQVEVDATSRIVRRLGFKEPRAGKDLKLTIDLGLQSFVDELLKEEIGSCVIMDAKTGEILALAGAPEFDPNIFIEGSSAQRLSLLNDGRKPMLNRAVSCAYPPGSTFKIIVAAAGLATGAIKEYSSFVCNGIFNLGKATFKCWKEGGHGSQNVTEGLTHSCNIFFYNLGRLLGAEQIHHYAMLFGLGSITGIDLPNETNGFVPSPFWKKIFLKEPWYEGDTVNYSIGQGYLLVTPIQMLRAVTIIADEGYYPAPYLLQSIDGKDAFHRKLYNVKLNKHAFRIVRAGMFKVVNDPTGTGQYAKIEGLDMAGKTGTAQPGTPGDTHAWFVGYIPADKPRFSFVIFLEHGGQGGLGAAQMARLIGTYLKENGFLK